MEKIYKNQVKLLLDVLPEVAKESGFALHGGTAINLFVRNMPRLSVDINLYKLILNIFIHCIFLKKRAFYKSFG